MSFVSELKRRNVFRVGIAYAVVSWLVLQVADILFEAIGTPEWVMQTLLVVLAIGLAFALFFAWAFELTPEGLKREKEVDRSRSITAQTGRKLDFAIIGLLALALAYFIWESRFAEKGPDEGSELFSRATIEPAAQVSDGRAPTPEDTAANRQSVAVLPFTNRSRNAEDQPFVEGVHDDLLTNLARIGGLKVISRTSVLRYRDTEKPIPEIAGELGVATIMEGAVQRSGDTVRINVQLIDAQSDEHLWAEIFDRELTAENLFAIQSEISEKIAEALETTLTDAERDRIKTIPTDNLAAYDAYVRGRQLVATRETDNLEQATREFQQAVELDPEFALAWVGVADSHDLLENYGVFDWQEAMDIREEAVNRALELDPELGEAWTSRGQFLADKRDLEASEEAFLKAIEYSPNYATAYHWYSLMIRAYGLRTPERVELAEKAYELDPRSPILGVNLGGAYRDQGLYARAERTLLDVLDREPNFPNAMAILADLYSGIGRFEKAMVYYRKAEKLNPGSPISINAQAWVYLQLGELEKAQVLLNRLEEMDPDRIGNGFLTMWSNFVRGNQAAALEAARWLVPRVEAVNGHFYFMSYFDVFENDPNAAKQWFLKSDPRWAQREHFPALVERFDDQACMYSWILIANGEPELGHELLDIATRYLTQELPAANEHWDQYEVQRCYLTAGDTEAALAFLQMRLDHNHIGFWRLEAQLPMFELIRHDERFNAMLNEHDRLIEEQRLAVMRLDAGAGP